MTAPRLTVLSGGAGKTPACFLVEARGARLVLDLGAGPEGPPDLTGVGPACAVILSHGHADHAGGLVAGLPALGDPEVWATAPVAADLGRATRPLPPKGARRIAGVRVTIGRAGHAPGAVWVHLAVGSGLIYAGDMTFGSAVYPADPPPMAATLIADASYGALAEDARPRQTALLDHLDAGGAALLPVPAAGRSAEIALALARRGRIPRLDGAVRAAFRALGRIAAAAHRQAADALEVLAETAPEAGPPDGVTLASPADADSGAARALALEARGRSEIILTGHAPPASLAARLIQAGEARRMLWDAHPTWNQTLACARAAGVRRILPAFRPRDALPALRRAAGGIEILDARVIGL